MPGQAEAVGRVNGCKVVATIEGVLRGLVHPGLQVVQSQKPGDIDPLEVPRSASAP